ncbi:MAG: NB-ARC domain-containing protein [Cyanobacteria bacterium J06643_4]
MMGIDAAIEYADQLLYERTGKHLSDLQSHILQQSWQGQTYSQVANNAGYSEGHIKDVASQLWQLLSEALGERITKGNLRSRLINRIKRTIKSAPGGPAVIATLRSAQANHARAITAAIAQPSSSPQPTTFLGREEAITTLHTLAQSHRIIVIQGEGGIGKTTLAQQYSQQFDHVLELLMAKETANITPVKSVVEEWLRQSFNEEPGREFGVTLSRLKHHLTAKEQQVCLLIDNLEPALDSNGLFIAAHRHYVELLRVLAASQATVIITSRDRLCEPSISVRHYRLPCLTVDTWQQFFQAHHITTEIDAPCLRSMHKAYGGNAKAMELLCATTVEDFEGDLSAYWQDNKTDLLGAADLRNLVGSQVNRLQTLDADAYRVFCRLGCYRYQDQPTLKADAITALMWDIAPAGQRQTLNSLRDRSLLECQKGNYWLHPVSRAEAIARLRETRDDWEKANRAAAKYWCDRTQTILCVADGLQALEAFYHLIAIQDYDAAANVLLQSRHNQWRQFLPLASSLYRMGLLQPTINAITQVLPHVQAGNNKINRIELNNILGDVYWITGEIQKAICCQKKTLTDAAHYLATQKRKTTEPASSNTCSVDRDNYYLKMLTVDAHLSLGLYSIDLWELAQAAEQFEQVISLATGTAHQAWADKATVGLALACAHKGETDVATELAESILEHFAGPDDEFGRYAYFLQLLGQTFGQLGDFAKSQALYERAISSAEAGHYVQVKAKALTGLAILRREQGDLEGALTLHTQAIDLCKTIGATCDLAEAYLQLGLSMGRQGDKGKGCFENAIALFSDIQAPQQAARVKAAARHIDSDQQLDRAR